MALYYAADDFGLSESGDRAVLELAADGALDGAAVMATHLEAGALERVKALAASGLEVGLHLNFTEGAPVSPPEEVSSLVDGDGRLFGLSGFAARVLSRRVRPDELFREVRAQWTRLEQVAGRVDYVDGHQHVQYLPQVCDRVLAFIERETLLGGECLRLGRFRGSTADPRAWLLTGLGGWLTLTRPAAARFRRAPLVMDLGCEVRGDESRVEVMVHPAHPDQPASGYPDGRYDYGGRCAQFVLRRSQVRGGDLEYGLARSPAALEEVEAYIASHPGACFGHTAAWRRAIREVYRVRSRVVVARAEGRVVGVAPWSVLHGPAGGRYMVIAPYASHGGILGDSVEVRAGLLAASVRFARRALVGHLHLRAPGVEALELSVPASFHAGRYVSPRIHLSPDVETCWQRTLSGRARTAIRKARKVGVSIERVRGDWEVFDGIFAEGNHALGSPFHGAPFYRALERNLGERLFTWVAWHQGRPAAAALAVEHGDTLNYTYGQNVHALRPTNANSLLIWAMIEQGFDRGLRWLDLGRSELDTSHSRFKEQWGAEAVLIDEALVPVLRGAIPDLVPTNPRFAMARRAWARLPLHLARTLGPWVSRGIG